jgi:cystathionine gamma-synthase
MTTAQYQNLLTDPLWRKEDLGKPIPDSPDAVSVALPTWDQVVGYEEGRSDIVEAMSCGYPRFFVHPVVHRLFETYRERFARAGEVTFAFPSESVARRCVDFMAQQAGAECRAVDTGDAGIYAIIAPEEAAKTLKSFWQHTGEIVSSRRARAAIESSSEPVSSADSAQVIRERIATWTDADAGDVYLYPSGMAALAASQRMMHALRHGAKSVQLGFPYVDLLKIQEKIGPGVYFVPEVSDAALAKVFELLDAGNICGLFTEFPGNPLLRCPDTEKLWDAIRKNGGLFIIDETIGSFVNVDCLRECDAVMTSLTKYVSGVGDVIAGSLVLNRESPRYDAMKAHLDDAFENLVWGGDAVALAGNCADFPERMAEINRNGERLADHLLEHPAVESVMYPKFGYAAAYERLLKPGGGYGGLLSVLTKDGARTAPTFFDALRVSKGPSLGTNYTMACPFTLLAHFDELDWAESLGVSRWLVRVSVGLEPPDGLIARFDEALAGA